MSLSKIDRGSLLRLAAKDDAKLRAHLEAVRALSRTVGLKMARENARLKGGGVSGTINETNNYYTEAALWSPVQFSEGTMPSGNWAAVEYAPSLGLLVAIPSGTGSLNVAHSSDGQTFANAGSFTGHNYNDLAWSEDLGLFVAAGANSPTANIGYSSDGVNWTHILALSGYAITSVAWSPELGKFCAVSSTTTNNRAFTSTDGVNWSNALTGINNQWQKVIWAADLGLFVAVSNSGTRTRVMTSADGVSWTSRNSPTAQGAGEINLFGLAWGAAAGVVVSVGATNSFRCMSSPDGINWTPRLTADESKAWRAVAWSDEWGAFAAVADSGTGNIRAMSSPDGFNWSSHAFSSALVLKDIKPVPVLRRFVGVGTSCCVFSDAAPEE